MDRHYQPLLGPSSISIDIDETDGWDDAEEIELGIEEHDLFLKDDFVTPNNGTNNPTSQTNLPNGKLSRNRSHRANGSTELINSSATYSKVQALEMGEVISGPAPVVYQTPDYQQFTGSLAPSSSTSVLISLVIVVVILCVTILPIIIPQSISPIDEDIPFENKVKNDSSLAQTHAQARCKCICPPLPHSMNNGTDKTNPRQRRLYVGNTPPNQCNCNNIVQPLLIDVKILLKEFCYRCECRYQSRNVTTIRRNVIFFIVVLFGLSVYMFIQYLLKYFRITRRNLPRQLRWLSHQMTESD